MNAKSCLNCSQLGSYNIGKTGRRCYGIAAVPAQFPIVIQLSALAGFYCGNWVQKEVQPVKLSHNHSAGSDFCPACTQHPIGEPNANTLHQIVEEVKAMPPERMRQIFDAAPKLSDDNLTPRGEAANTVLEAATTVLGAINECEDAVDRVIAVMEKKNPTSH